MFINRHRQNAQRNSDLEKHERSLRDSSNTEVNTRWRPQSFMVAVAGAVAKLPKRSASNASQNNATHSQSTRGVGSVLGSIRRVASNTSSIASWGSTRSHVSGSSQQSYGIAVTTPIPPLSRIDGMETSSDAVEAHYNSHNHAY
ncbi:hypothetical protein BDF14DRAFT_1786697 [Spinellus fusiger]|nr:hypothetical protein BDF14DRAFT_1786697 [Spinellus fusiger]